MIKITFPDGNQKEFESGISCLAVAQSISQGLAKNCIAAKVSGKMVDMSTVLDQDCSINFYTFDKENEQSLDVIRHDTAHLLAQAVKDLYPKTQITIGPSVEDGFYYDFAREEPFSSDDLSMIERKMTEIAGRNYAFERLIFGRNEAVEFFKNQGEFFKAEIIGQIPENEAVSVYKQGDFHDLCRGPHAPSMGYLKHFKLLRVSAAYWKGDAKNASLQRIYGTAWGTKKSLDDYLFRIEEAKKRDHRKLGKELGLFHQQQEAVGDVFWHPKGQKLYLIIQQYIRDLLEKNGYEEVKTPIMVKRTLWEQSGHWEKFGKNMFTSQVDEEDYAIKPMNCPCHVQIFNQGLRSYRDLPLRMAEFGCCHRYEPSGSLYGIMRVRSFVQDDAHIFCTEDQIAEETVAFCKLLTKVYNDFGFTDIKIKFSDRPEVRAGTDETWDKAENALKIAIEKAGYDYILNPGEGAFYGPKLEFVLKDAIGRDWQCGTLQVDFVLPERLGAEYIAADGTKQRPVMLHRAILGSMERFIGMLIEHYAGALPVWLAPVQVAVLGVSDVHKQAVVDMTAKLQTMGIRAVADLTSDTVSYKIRNHSLQKIPFVVVLGDKEIAENTVAVRKFGEQKNVVMSLDDFVDLCVVK